MGAAPVLGGPWARAGGGRRFTAQHSAAHSGRRV